MAIEVRKPVYGCVARQVIDSKHILSLMARVNWEVKDVMCQHSQYVDVLFNVSTGVGVSLKFRCSDFIFV